MIRTLLLACLFFYSFALVAQPIERQLSGTVSFEIKEFLLSTVEGSFSDVQRSSANERGPADLF